MSEVSAAENLALHTEWAEAENRHDLSRHGSFLHDDITVLTAGREPSVGFDAYLTTMRILYAAMPDFHASMEDQLATEDRVVCRWLARGTHAGELFGIPPSGRTIEYGGVSLWEFDAVKARRGWVFPDVAALARQLG